MVILGMAYGIGFTTLTSVQVEFQNSISIKVHACLTITGEGWAEWAEWAEWASQSLSRHFDRGPAGLELRRHGNFSASDLGEFEVRWHPTARNALYYEVRNFLHFTIF